jgi:hypothetical protein
MKANDGHAHLQPGGDVRDKGVDHRTVAASVKGLVKAVKRVVPPFLMMVRNTFGDKIIPGGVAMAEISVIRPVCAGVLFDRSGVNAAQEGRKQKEEKKSNVS